MWKIFYAWLDKIPNSELLSQYNDILSNLLYNLKSTIKQPNIWQSISKQYLSFNSLRDKLNEKNIFLGIESWERSKWEKYS